MGAEVEAISSASGKGGIPDLPGENPSKDVFVKWIQVVTDEFTTAGLSALLRQEVPHSLKKLAPRSFLLGLHVTKPGNGWGSMSPGLNVEPS